MKAFDVNGCTVERTRSSRTRKSRKPHLIADKLGVTLGVQPAAPDESVTLIEQRDLVGIEAFVKK